MRKRILSLFLAAAMLTLTVLPASAATASTIRLMKTTGTVSVTNATKRTLSTRANMLLYSGYQVQTKASSYAWINLDDTKLTKMDASSKVDVRKHGKKLELLVNSGSLYFNVTKPLAADESLNIRTSTMLLGIRGTCGWVKELDDFTTELYILEGKVECAVADPRTGETQTVTLVGGEKAVFTVDPTRQEGARCEITQARFGVDDVDSFVMEEVRQDPDLYNIISRYDGTWSFKNDWFLSDAYYNEEGQYFVLTEDYKTWKRGSLWYGQPCYGGFSLEMDYYTGSADRALGGADGITVAFYADENHNAPAGGDMGFTGSKGYAIELDTYYGNSGDPNYNHIALVNERASNHLVAEQLPESEDEQWHHLKIVVENGICSAYVDGALKLSHEVEPTGYGWVGIIGSTGDGVNLHAVRNIAITDNSSHTGA